MSEARWLARCSAVQCSAVQCSAVQCSGRDSDKRQQEARRRELIVLIHHHLQVIVTHHHIQVMADEIFSTGSITFAILLCPTFHRNNVN
jgi:hypothetical protein